MPKQSGWQSIYQLIEAAVINLESVDQLLRRVVGAIANSYSQICLVWTELETETPELIRVYGTWRAFQQLDPDLELLPVVPTESHLRPTVDVFAPRMFPLWLQDYRQPRADLYHQSGLLRLPVWSGDRLRWIFQLYRDPQGELGDWQPEEVEALQVIGSQLSLGVEALYWRQRLEQSRQQSALVGSIVRLLNSSLDPAQIMSSIVAELGKGLHSDRCILVDLRHNPVEVLATWHHAQAPPCPTEGKETALQRDEWHTVMELFIQGAANYLEVHRSDPHPLSHWLKTVDVVSALIMPLFVQEKFFGAVVLLSCHQDRAYNLDELQTIRQVADQAAIALTNAQDYQSLWNQQETLRLQNQFLRLEIIHDPLTKLFNRRSLERELEKLSQPPPDLRSPFSVIVCDLDFFKQVNDSYGHLVGDQVLRILAQRLQKNLRQGTPAYRYGGEEFVVVLKEVSSELALEVAERLRFAIHSAPFQTPAGLLHVTASFGVAQHQPDQDPDAWSVVQRADKALYEAKRQGRDRVIFLT